MNDAYEETYPPELFPWLYPELFPEYQTAADPEPDPAPDPSPYVDPTPEPTPFEVISVDELLDRLAPDEAREEGLEDDAGLEGIESAADPGEVLADVPITDPDPIVIIAEQLLGKLVELAGDIGKIEKHLEVIEQTADHPALTTSFADYTVTEALLLLLLLSAFIAACAKMLRGGFSWLRS